MTKRCRRISVLLLGGIACCACAINASAQEESQYTIRVEADQVLVTALPFEPAPPGAPVTEWRDSEGRRVILGLTAKDFHLFQDGVEQKIQSATYKSVPYRIVRDNAECHAENFPAPGVRWIEGEWSRSRCPLALTAAYIYEIAFTPPHELPGSCHQVALTVDRPNAVVVSRKAYCRTNYSTSDPLNGTPEGQRLESELASKDSGELPLSLQAGCFRAGDQSARVEIALALPWNSVKTEWRNGRLWSPFRVLGVVYRKDGSVAWRFSDSELSNVEAPMGKKTVEEMETDPAYLRSLPTRYERQIQLPAGEYDLRVVFSDKVNFGRAEAQVVVESHDEEQLSISSVLLSNRYQKAAAASRGAGPQTLPGGFVPLVSQEIEVEPAGSTRFKRGDLLIAYFEVYEPVAAAKLGIHARIVDAQTNQVRGTLKPFDKAGYRSAGSAVVPIAGKFSTGKLNAGAYRLEVQATDAAGRSTAWRTASFTVE